MPLVRCLVAAVAAAGLAALPAAAGGERIAVLPLRVERLQLNEVNRLNLMVRQRAGTRGSYLVEDEQATNQIVEAALALGLDCDINDVACATRIGKLADVPWLMLGQAVGDLEGHIGLELRIVDTAQGSERRRAIALLPSDIAAQEVALDALVDALCSTAPLPTLAVASKPTGADVVVDGILRGITPLAEPIGGLVVGEHVVTVRKDGFPAKSQTVKAVDGESVSLSLDMSTVPVASSPPAPPASLGPVAPTPVPTPPGPPPSAPDVVMPFTAAGAATLVAIGGGVALLVGLQPWLRYDQARTEIERARVSDPDFSEVVVAANEQMATASDDWSRWGLVSVISGGALLAVGGLASAAGVWWGLAVLDSDREPQATTPVVSARP